MAQAARSTPPPVALAWLPDPAALLARARQENFPVALRILPGRLREPLLAIYGFARLVDHVGDELEGDRTAALAALERELDAALAGGPAHPLVARMARILRERGLPDAPLRRLLEANRRDQTRHRYETWPQLEDYCALSANPVGELVLHLLDAADPDAIALSDRICTALQLLEHCQDVAEDRARGRVYLPREDLARFGCGETELSAASASPALRDVIRFETERASRLLHEGAGLLARLRGAGRLAVAGFAAGGHAVADALARARFDVLASRVRPRRRDVARHALALLWRARA